MTRHHRHPSPSSHEPEFFGGGGGVGDNERFESSTSDTGEFSRSSSSGSQRRRHPSQIRRSRARRSNFLGCMGGAMLWVFLLAIVAVVGFGVVYGAYAYERMYGKDDVGEQGQPVVVVSVDKGDVFNTVVRKLEQSGVLRGFMGIPDRWLFRAVAINRGNSNQIKPGAYQFGAGRTLPGVYGKLIEGSKDFKLTIPEGKAVFETASVIAANWKEFNPDTFLELVKSPSTIGELGFDPEKVATLEGYLYPSTYYYAPDMTQMQFLHMMTDTFKTKLNPHYELITAQPEGDTLTFQEHLVMASLIEKEARTDADRPLIASVLLNRLAQKMPLQIDATLQYANGDFATPPRAADKAIVSPFNTYKIKGLPPGPICSPRLESILATYNTPPTDYLYYVYKGEGSHAFAVTYDEHRANIVKYLKNRTSDREQVEAMAEEALPLAE